MVKTKNSPKNKDALKGKNPPKSKDSLKSEDPLERKDSVKSICIYLLLGAAITALLILVNKNFIEPTPWGHRAQSFAFELLQGRLSSFNPEEELPVVVVDISGIPLTPEGYKDREKLIPLIKAIADEKPSAIALDIMVSPEAGQWRTQTDPELLKMGLELTERDIPVFFAVDKEMPLANPEAFLGEARFANMAVTVAIYENDAKRIPLWVRDKTRGEKLPSLSLALARIERKKNPEKVSLPQLPDWSIETIDDFPGKLGTDKDIEYADALVNYSKFEAIQQTDLLTRSASSVKEFGRKFKNRYIILGNGAVTGPDDFAVPGRLEEVSSGVYMHACAAYTLMREPMYEFKPLVHFVADVILIGFILLTVAFLRWRHLGDKTRFPWQDVQRKLVWGSGALVTFLAFLLVSVAGVLWLDFILIVVALFLHPWVEKMLTLLWRKIPFSWLKI